MSAAPRQPAFAMPDGYELRAVRPGDSEELHAAIERNRDELAKWLSWAQQPNARETREHIARALRAESEGRRVQRAIVHGSALVGDVGLYVEAENATGAIGYWLDREHRGRGVMSAAVRALAGHGFGELALRRVEIRTDVLNTASRALAERLGFQLDGVLRQSYRVAAGHYSDDAVYSLLDSEAELLS